MSENTRARILRAGARLIRENGFSATGLSAILTAANVPKGSFYYYFRSKDDFGLELVRYLGNQISKAFNGYLCCEYEEPSIVRLKQFFDFFKGEFTSEELPLGCPIGNLAQELAAVSGEFREKLKPVFQVMYDSVTCCLMKAQKSGEVSLPFPPEKTARFIINSWQGALIALKVSNNSEPFEVFEEYIFEDLLKTGRE